MSDITQALLIAGTQTLVIVAGIVINDRQLMKFKQHVQRSFDEFELRFDRRFRYPLGQPGERLR